MSTVAGLMEEDDGEWNEEAEMMEDENDSYWDENDPLDVAMREKFESFNMDWDEEEGEVPAAAVNFAPARAAPEEGEIATFSNSRDEHKKADATMPTPTGSEPPRGQMNKSTIRVSRAGHQVPCSMQHTGRPELSPQATARKRNRLERVSSAAAGEDAGREQCGG